jgi:hypothetical protein
MFKTIVAITFVVSLLCGGASSLFAQDEPGEEDLMIHSYRLGQRLVEGDDKSSGEVDLGAAPMELVVRLSADGKKPSIVLVNGRIVPKTDESLNQPEVLQRKDIERKAFQAGLREGPYTISGEMDRPKKETAPQLK